ncbi:MAG TPA: S8 family serine peptidase [Gemmataceae bacterium]|nr:S8 family serine peptidase [Gemmataceae bacterium]
MLLGFTRFFHSRRPRKSIRRATPRRFGRGAQLESRMLLSTTAITSAFTPAQIRHAYGLDTLTFTNSHGQSFPLDGRGQTVAIVAAYRDMTITSDLKAFDSWLGLPDASLQIATPQGPMMPDPTGAWSFETALDVEWTHAIAPGASIMLVEAASGSITNLMGAVNYARQQAGVVAVSMSWGTSEFAGETGFDSIFTTPAGHVGGSSGVPGSPNLPGGVTFVAASGDNGSKSGATWPAVSPNVVGVGGTSLTTTDSQGTYGSESGWSNSGGGVSWYEQAPGYQKSVQNSGYRTSPDVALNANPSPGMFVVSGGRWYTMGGTSVAAPMMAGMVALVDQARALNGQGSLDGATQTLPGLYQAAATAYGQNFNDVTTGNNGYQAGTGYDLVTGLGSPRPAGLVQTLAGPSSGQTTTGGAIQKTPAPSHPTSQPRPVPVATVSFIISGADGQPIIVTVPASALTNLVLTSSMPSARHTAFPTTNSSTSPADANQPVVQPQQATAAPTSLLSEVLKQFNADLNVHAPSAVPLPAAPEGSDKGPEQTPAVQPDGTSGVAPTPGAHRALPIEKTETTSWSDAGTAAILARRLDVTSDNETSNAGASAVEPVSPLAAVLLIFGGYEMAPELAGETESRPKL